MAVLLSTRYVLDSDLGIIICTAVCCWENSLFSHFMEEETRLSKAKWPWRVAQVLSLTLQAVRAQALGLYHEVLKLSSRDMVLSLRPQETSG